MQQNLDTEFHDTVLRYRETEHAIELLRRGANPNASDGEAFFNALLWDQERLVRECLKHGAKPTPKALSAAIRCDQKSLLFTRLLLEAGADPNAATNYTYSDEDGQALDRPRFQTPLMIAVQESRLPVVKLLVKRGADIGLKLQNGDTALRVAAKLYDAEIVRFLLQKGASTQGIEQELLNFAVSRNDMALFDWLKAHHALPKTLRWPRYISEYSFPIMQRMIEAGASPNSTSPNESIPLVVAIYRHDLTAVHYLLAHGANVNIANGSPLQAALPTTYESPSEAAKNDAIEAAARKADPFSDPEDNYSRTYTDSMKQQRQIEDTTLVELLLQHGANPNLRAERWERTLLHEVAERNRVATFQILLRYGADLELKDRSGRTPLAVAAQAGKIEMIEALLAAGANIEAHDLHGRTPLMLALANAGGVTYYAPISTVVSPPTPASVLEVLLRHGANVRATDAQGATLLHLAAMRGEVPIARDLLQRGLAVDIKATHGATPLWLACKVGQYDMAKFLLENGANPDAPGPRGITPRGVAAEKLSPHVEMHGEATERDWAEARQMAEAFNAPVAAARKRILALLKDYPPQPSH